MIGDFSYHQNFGSAISNLFFSTNYIVGENALHKLFTGAKLNELKKIVKEYEKTVFIEEALHRLVEIHYHIGLEDEAKKYAKILGYNYNSSKWFEQTYIIFNKNYKLPKIKNDKDGFLKKIIKKIR